MKKLDNVLKWVVQGQNFVNVTDRFSAREIDPKDWIIRKETANNGSQLADVIFYLVSKT